MRSSGLKTSLGVAALIALLSTASCSTSSQASSAGSSPASPAGSPLTIAYVTSLTGVAAGQYAGSQAGFLARLDLQNSMGGVNGHKLVPLVLDDQTSPSTIVTAIQLALSKGVIGIVSGSELFFLAAKYPNQAGVPVTGSFSDGPEWGEQPYTNMFSSDHGSVDPKYPVNTLIGTFIKQHGGTVIGTYGYSISPQSTSSTIGNAPFVPTGRRQGRCRGHIDSPGQHRLHLDSAHRQTEERGLDLSQPAEQLELPLNTAFVQAGVKLKVALFVTGYEPDIIHSSSWSALQKAYFFSIFRPFSLPNAGTEQMAAAMQKYAGFTKNQFPNFGESEAWVGADLMIQGIKGAGSDPTHASVIKSLRSITAYNADGLLPTTLDYSTIFGHDSPDCAWALQVHPSGFVPLSPQPVCGHDVPGTTTANTS